MGRLLVALALLATVLGCTTTAATDRDGFESDGSASPSQEVSPSREGASSTSTDPPHNRDHTGGSAAAALATIEVKGRAPMTGYDRDQFGSSWTDDTNVPFGHNGCDTRNDVLRRDLYHPVIEAGTFGCVVLSGELRDPYSAARIDFLRGTSTSTDVQIDHVVALGDSWQTGAQQWIQAKRQDFANDPLNLLAVDGATNTAKGASDAASWLPPHRGFWCTYVARQTAVKAKYGLWMTAAEKATIHGILDGCPQQALPTEPGRLHRPTRPSVGPATSEPAPATTHHPPSTGHGCEPGYRPCIPIADDLNCDDIDNVLKPIHVTGNDPYNLDADGDRLGCTT